MLRRVIPVVSILLLCAGCSSMHTHLDDNPPFSSHQYTSHDLKVQWKSDRTDTGIRVTGTVTNPRAEQAYNAFTLTAKVLDGQGRVLAEQTQPFKGRFAGTESFTMEIPMAHPEQASRISYFYSYGYELSEEQFQGHFRSAL